MFFFPMVEGSRGVFVNVLAYDIANELVQTPLTLLRLLSV